MLVTKHLNRDKTNLRTKICGTFLAEQEQQGDCVTFVEEKDRMGANMAFAHVIRDDANDVMTVYIFHTTSGFRRPNILRNTH